jgi:hypothetical protein
MVQKKTVYHYTERSKRKLPVNIHDGAKGNCLPTYNMVKGKFPINIQKGAKENCLPTYNMVQRKISHQYTEWCKRELPTSIQHGVKKLTLDV